MTFRLGSTRTDRRRLRASASAGVGAASLLGVVALAGCAPAVTPAAREAGGSYADGTYTAEGSYQTPETVETISVTVTLADGVVTDVTVEGDPTRPESAQYQSQFIGGISDAVVGKPLDELSVSRVAGSSLTSGGFNQAIDAIKAEAAA